METTIWDFVRRCGHIERSAFPGEIQKIFAHEGDDQTAGPVPELIQYGGHYFVNDMGQILYVSGPCELNQETTEILNDFCKVNRWSYEICPDPLAYEAPLRIVFHTRFFVSPA
jgi:hypothetical protein